MLKEINAFDIDGVISIGIYPGKDDIIITGRSYEEYVETIKYLNKKEIFNQVYFNPIKFEDKSRENSGLHKSNIINMLKEKYVMIKNFFEDDEVQKEVIENNCNDLNVIYVCSNLVKKENIRRDKDGKEI